ncbi:MAG: ABC transporter permease [Candidatus Methanofastidiosa archaeon]|nr:ABC transporter permease [Candidatus Methanofastidiosa archaeon]
MNSILLRGILVTTEKNIRIYYTKAPVLIFGLLFPLFMFFAFYLGRNIELAIFVPGFIAMALFFTSSSVGPLITPWEKQAGTYERLLSFPVNINTIVLGDLFAGALYGLIITLVVSVFLLPLVGLTAKAILMPLVLVLGSLCFSGLGVLLASPSVKSPANIMMFSSLIRFPLIFISGIFIPFSELNGIGMYLSYLSPLSYLVDAFNSVMAKEHILPLGIDLMMLIVFTALFVYMSCRLHKRNMMKGL